MVPGIRVIRARHCRDGGEVFGLAGACGNLLVNPGIGGYMQRPMLAKRVIPCLDVHDRQVTRGVRFGRAEAGELGNVGDAVALALTPCQSGCERAGGGRRAGRLDHMVQVLTQGAADAVLAARVFHFGRCTVADVKQHLAANGIPVHAPAYSLLPRTGAVSTGSNGSHT